MSIYPSLEDMKVDQLLTAQQALFTSNNEKTHMGYPYPGIGDGQHPPETHLQNSLTLVYPTLKDFMGLELSDEIIAQNMPEYSNRSLVHTSSAISSGAPGSNLIAPLSNQTLGLQKAQVSHGIREVILCKDKDGKVGIRVRAIDKGIFVALVTDKSPAALAGLRFGDQILQINGENVAGFTMEQVHNMLKKSPNNGISVVVRDRPFERTITLHKDKGGVLGFQFKNGKITAIVKDSSAARNGVLLEHQLLEIDGQNIVGLKDKEISKILEKCEGVVTITVIPSFIYDHMVKQMAGSLLKGLMDHSVPNV